MRRQVAMIATAAGLIGLATAATALEGISSKDRASINIRHLQSELMVAALSCNLRPQYNATMGRFEAELIQHGQDLRRLFKRTYGSSGERELNRFVTALANQASASSLNRGPTYCSDAASLFNEVLTVPVSGLAVFWDGRATIGRELLPGTIESAAAPN